MDILTDTWLEGLTKHPIFQIDKADQQLIQTRSDLQHNSLITLRDKDLFVAVGSQIRVLNLTECKNSWLKVAQDINEGSNVNIESWINLVQFKVLNTPEIDFKIESVLPNKNGRLLAVKGEKRLVVVCLPRQGFSTVDCRTLSIGSRYYPKSKILKLEWHPLSETRTHLVILGSDNYLRIFDISVEIEEPEQSFDLSPVSKTQNKIGFSLEEDDGDEDAVSFSLGGTSQDQSGWEPFTVFYTLKNGHIYALCPVIPQRSSVRRHHLDSLLCISEAKFQQAKNGSDEHNTLSYLFKLQSAWIETLSKVNDGDNLTIVNNQNLYPVLRQGPFVIPQVESRSEASDILYINSNSISIIALAFKSGEVHHYILSTEIDAQWLMPMKNSSSWQIKLGSLLSESSYLPTASFYESLNVKSDRIRFVLDPLYNDTYYMYHSSGVHAVSIREWIQSLSHINTQFETGKTKQAEIKKSIEDWFKAKTVSDLQSLIKSSPISSQKQAMAGLVVITDIYLSYSILALTDDYQLITRDLHVRLKANKNTVDIKAQLKNISRDDESGYRSLLPLPMFKAPDVGGVLPKQAQIVVPKNMAKEIEITEESLLFFSKSTESIRRETFEIKKLATKVESRLSIQQKELERQVKFLRELYERANKVQLDKARGSQEEKIKRITQTHSELCIRMDKQLRHIIQGYQPELSNAEKEWITKLEQLSKKIKGDYAARVNLLKQQLKQVTPTKTEYKKGHIHPVQLNNVLRTLQKQETVIEKVRERTQNLELKLSFIA